MPTIDIKLRIKFLLTNELDKIQINDLTVLNPDSPYKAGLSIKSPSGVFYNKVNYIDDPDFTESRKNFEINIPKKSDGSLLQGGYQIIYSIDDLQGQVLTKTYDLVFNYVRPVPTLKTNIDISQPVMVSVDTTSYEIASVTPVIDREFKIHFPSTTNKQPVSSTTDVVLTNQFFHTGLIPLQHEVSLKSSLIYDFSEIQESPLEVGTFLVEDYIALIESVNVVNPLDENHLYNVLANMYEEYQSYKGKDYNRALQLKSSWEEACAYVDMIEIAVKSGNGQDVECYTKKLLALGQACECISKMKFDSPQIVYGASGKLGAILNGELPMPSDGVDGINGVDGTDGTDGTDGIDGVDGVSVVNTEIDSNSDLIITLSDGSTLNAGSVSENEQRIFSVPRYALTPQASNVASDTLAFWNLILESVRAVYPTYQPQLGDVVLINNDAFSNGQMIGVYEYTIFEDSLLYINDTVRSISSEILTPEEYDVRYGFTAQKAYGFSLKTINKVCSDFKFAFEDVLPKSENSSLAYFSEKGISFTGKWSLVEGEYANLERDSSGDVIIAELQTIDSSGDGTPIKYPKLYWDSVQGASFLTNGNNLHRVFKVPMIYETNQLTPDELIQFGNIYVKSRLNEPETLYLAVPDIYGDVLTRQDVTLTVFLDGVDIIMNTRLNSLPVQ